LKLHAQITSISERDLDVWMLDVNNGLSQGMVNDLVLDQQGYLWIATKEGLNRYDGSTVKVFRHNPKDSLSISDNLITCLLVDHANRLWVGTQSNGLNLYDRQTEAFNRFHTAPTSTSNYLSKCIDRLYLSPDGNVCVLARDSEVIHLVVPPENSGNNSYEIIDFCSKYPLLDGFNHCKNGDPATSTDNNQNKYFFSNDGSFWFRQTNDTLIRYSKEALLGKAKPVVLVNADPDSERATDLLCTMFFDQNKESAFWSDGKHILNKFNPESNAFEPFLELPPPYTWGRHNFCAKSGDIWSFDRHKDFILKINATKGTLDVVRLPFPNANINPSLTFKEDTFGNIWMPSNGFGVGKVSSRLSIFERVPLQKSALRSYWLLRQEKAGAKASCDLELVERIIKNYHSTFSEKTRDAIIGNSRIPAHISITNDGQAMLVGVSDDNLNNQCLVRVKLGDGNVNLVHCQPTQEEELHRFSPIFFDRNKGTWLANSVENDEVHLYHIPFGETRPVKFTFPINPGPLQYRFISDWYEDEQGRWWFATVKGLFAFDPATEHWQHFKNISGTSGSLSLDIALSICPDPLEPNRYLWIGTEGGGLNRFDRVTASFIQYTTADGLPNNVIYGIQSDHRNNLWLSTNLGLCLFNPSNKQVRNFTKSDGLNGNEFNRYQYSKAPDGRLFFGGVDGATAFYPEDVYRDSSASVVIINGLKVINQPITYRNSSQSAHPKYTLSAPIEYTDRLEFTHDVGMISLSFSMLEYTVPEQHVFRYQLVGLDQDWVEVGSSKEAVYTNLSPGNYTFQVIGRNSNHVWSKPTQLAITVLPPWWATWWFRSLLVLFSLSLIYLFYRERLEQAVKVERMRNRIAQDLHDEIGSTLSSISLFSEVLKTGDKNLSPKSQTLLEKISNSSSEMMESMNDIVWTIKADNDRFEDVLNRMRAFAVNTTECRGIDLAFEAPKEAEDLNLNMEVRKNVYLIFKEGFNNAIKYANANAVKVHVSLHNKQLQLVIQDNGIGFEQERIMNDRTLMGGNGVRGMHARASKIGAALKIDSIPSSGTTIQLRVDLKTAIKSIKENR